MAKQAETTKLPIVYGKWVLKPNPGQNTLTICITLRDDITTKPKLMHIQPMFDRVRRISFMANTAANTCSAQFRNQNISNDILSNYLRLSP